MKTTVYALGGSILTQNLEKLEEYGNALQNKEEQSIIVTGAGNLKKHIEATKDKANQGEQDMVGIKATRLNAETLKPFIDCHPTTPTNIEEVRNIASTGKNMVMGGLTPGYSTDAVAATVAEITNAEKLVVASKTKGVYEKDPEKEESEHLEEVSVEELKKKTEGNQYAGEHDLIDQTALNIIQRSKISTKMLKGEPKNLENIEESEGTLIVF